MQSLALRRQEIDWHRLRKEVTAYAGDAQAPQDTYPAIEYACTQLKDHGSRLYQPRSTPAFIQSRIQMLEAATAETHRRKLTYVARSPFATRRSFVLAMLKSGGRRYAYLVIPSSWTNHAEDYDPRRAHRWAEDLSSLVAKGIQQGAEGWILDLRGTVGIHATPLLAGLQSLLGDSKVLTLHGPHSREAISIEHGAVVEHFGWGNTQVDERLDEPVPLQQATAPVALLVDRGTNGAGEGVSIAFTGRRHTCFLGERTAGATEWGPVKSFSDGAVLVIMSEQIEDRQGHPYPEGLTPQILLDQPAAIPDVMADSGINAAKIWLDTQLPECQPHTQ